MDTKRLRQFCVIAETGSLTKAAGLLHITHSGLSKSMKLLQEELNCMLLRPDGRGLALTDDGLQIYQRAKAFLAQEEILLSGIAGTKQQALRIGTVEIFLLPMCSQLKFHPLFADYPITLLDLSPGQLEQMVANRELDYGITYVPNTMENVEIIELGTYRLGCYHLSGTFKGEKISEVPFAVPALGLSSNPLGIKERDGWVESLTPRNRKFAVNLLSTGLELTLQGLCAICIPKFLAHQINKGLPDNKKLIDIPIPKEQASMQTAYLIKHKSRSLDDQFKQIKKMIQIIVKD